MHRSAIRPKPQPKLSRVSQPLTIYTNSPVTSNPLRYAIMLANALCLRIRVATTGLELERADRFLSPRETEVEFASDSPLEGDGFEPSVPVSGQRVEIATFERFITSAL
jgi:hypothetical protein